MGAEAATKRTYRMAARAVTAAATRERILESAWKQFSEWPYEDVRLTDIAAAAGVTVQTLHSHFGPKEDLFIQAWGWAFIPDAARRESAPTSDVAAAVRIIYDSYELQGDAALRVLAEEDRIEAVHEMAEAGRAWHRGWVERTFAPLLEGLSGAARERRLVAIVVATDLLVWKLLRREMGLARKKAERIVIEMITATKGAP